MPLDFCLPTSSILPRRARVFWTFSRPVFNAQFLPTKQMPSASPYTVELLRRARVFLTFSMPVFNAQFLMTKQMQLVGFLSQFSP